MSDRATRSGRILLLALVIGTAFAAEWAVRRFAAEPAAASTPECPIAISTPAPAIGAEPGASTITRLYERHPTLGWVPAPDSPHHPRLDRIPHEGDDWIALFGDGSIAGSADRPAGSLPERLERSLGRPVISWAVAGHGLDRVVARTVETLSEISPPPRTAVVGVRVDAVETLAVAPAQRPRWLPRLRLVELARERLQREPSQPGGPSPRACVPAIDRARLRSLLEELRTTAARRHVELVVSLHAPAAPRPRHAAELALLNEELDAMAIHRVDGWDPDSPAGVQERRELAASRLEQRLAVVADLAWGTRIEFGTDGTFDRYPSAGFGAAVPRGRWTMDENAQLEVVPPPGRGGIIAELELRQAVTFEEDTRELTVRVGGVAVGRWPLRSLQRAAHDTFYIDEGLAAQRPLVFRFEIESLRTPAELGLWPARQKYGVLVASLTLRPDATHPGGGISEAAAASP